jgi:hypothetical protein
VAKTTGDTFAGSFTDVELELVTIDSNTQVSTPVPGGGCIFLQNLSFSATAQLAATPDMGTSSGATIVEDSGNATAACPQNGSRGGKCFSSCDCAPPLSCKSFVNGAGTCQP